MAILEETLVSDIPEIFGGFGESVSISGNKAIVGAPLEDGGGGSSSGRAYIYTFDGISTWSLEETLTSDNPEISGQFGYSVSINGDKAIVGAYFEDGGFSSSGRAYIYDFDGVSTWSLEESLVSDNPEIGGRFGISVSISGDKAIVGAYVEDFGFPQSGRAYVYDFDGVSTWALEETLVSDIPEVSGFFGRSVAISGDKAIVGAPLEDGGFSDSGKAYVYDFDGVSTWALEETLVSDIPEISGSFGESVSISGNKAIVGARLENGAFSNSGRAYIYSFDGVSTWTLEETLVSDIPEASGYFGYSVSISGDKAIVGAYGENGGFSDSGKAYVYDFDGVSTWALEEALVSDIPEISGSFGRSVAIVGNKAMVGASQEDSAFSGDGRVYIYDLSGPQSSSQSSSSSEPITFTEQLNQIIAGNNPENLVLFTYTPESGFSENVDENQILFQFRTVNNEYFNYDNLLNPPEVQESDDECYVPEDKDVNIKHEPIFYVDLIVRNSGVKDISVRAQEEKYQNEQVKYSFIIPKFTWSQDLYTDAIASNVSYTPLADATGSFWAGTEENQLYKIEYNSNVAASAFSTAEEGTINNIIVNPTGTEMYVTTDTKLKKYTVENYLDNSNELQLFVTEDISVDNVYKIMSWYDNNIWTALPELGTIQELDPDFLTEVSEVSGFDAPFKILHSTYHDAYFISGTNVLWKYDGSITAVYGIEGYSIFDFDISKNGQLCISLNGVDDSYIRIVDRNFFRILKSVRMTDGTASYCKFCSNEYFYALAEIDVGGDQFLARHHLYNTINGGYQTIDSPNTLFKEATEETSTPAAKPVEILYPNGGENVLIGSELEVLWKSTKSVNDSVKIELYKEGSFLRTITDSTPNTGVFAWDVPATIEIATDYTVRMEWLAAEVNPDNEDFSDATFNMVDILPSSSETEVDFFGSIGVDYDEQNDQVVVVLSSGLVGFVQFEDFTFQGWVDSGIPNYTAMVVKNGSIKEIGTVSKVRIFVGSQPYLSDKWDSGIIETDLNSIYYGGGDNLTPGETYHVNIQVYSTDSGWSEVQNKKWIMPKN